MWQPSPCCRRYRLCWKPIWLLGTAVLLCNTQPQLHAPTSSGSGGDSRANKEMQDLLHWALNNSDPELLKTRISEMREANSSLAQMYGQDVLDALFFDESSVLQQLVGAIRGFHNVTVTDDEVVEHLEVLRDLVEQIDNAANLHVMGGLVPLFEMTTSMDRGNQVRTEAIWSLGVAVSNNPNVQNDLVELGALETWAKRLTTTAPEGCSRAAQEPDAIAEGFEFCNKLLFALSALMRNNDTIQHTADELGVLDWMADKGLQHASAKVSKKAMGILDIIVAQNPKLTFLDRLISRQDAMGASLLKSIRGTDVDAVEKALKVLQRLLSLRPFLFGDGFRSEVANGVYSAIGTCEKQYGVGDEICQGLDGMGKHLDLTFAARDIDESEL
eukprot:gnl/MRDRNA2_/MRDRNA2_18837_c0_seq1.p1 gnl/MRDRNA2_/MRDRNA2_18837_c0~~gnl/MRDRNA2_/MRDRNA2_18837_c0_seq1.p1  ORF type:complete len:386 (-),score=73.53 gnl/MRDRNA2_/MRDRNA2_18837_c0_seq1:75-1232(-)